MLLYHDFPVVQPFSLFLKLLSNGEVDIVVAEGAEGLGLEAVSVLDNDFGLSEVSCNLTCSKVDVCQNNITTKTDFVNTGTYYLDEANMDLFTTCLTNVCMCCLFVCMWAVGVAHGFHGFQSC